MSGCLGEFLVNGERLPLEGGTDRFDVQQVGEVSSQCDVVIAPPGSPDGDTVAQWQLPVIIVCSVIGVCLIVLVILLLVFCVRRRRSRHGKGKPFFTAVASTTFIAFMLSMNNLPDRYIRHCSIQTPTEN